MVPQVRLPGNRTVYPEQVGHLPLSLPPAATETHVFSALQNESLISVGQLCDDEFQAIFNKTSLQVLENIYKHHSNRKAKHIRWSMVNPTNTDSSTSTGSQ